MSSVEQPLLTERRAYMRRWTSNPSWDVVPDKADVETLPDNDGARHFVWDNDLLVPYNVFEPALNRLRECCFIDLSTPSPLFCSRYLHPWFVGSILYCDFHTAREGERTQSIQLIGCEREAVDAIAQSIGLPYR